MRKRNLLVFTVCFCGAICFSPPEAFSQDSVPLAESVNEITVELQYFFGRPNPALVITDPDEIQYILSEVADMDKEQVPCDQVYADKKPWSNGVSLHIRSDAKIRHVNMSKGFKVTKNACSSKKNRKIMDYLVNRVLNSKETHDQISSDLKETVKNAVLAQ